MQSNCKQFTQNYQEITPTLLITELNRSSASIYYRKGIEYYSVIVGI